MNNEQIPDFIMNLWNNNYDWPSGMSNDYPVPDFISQMDTKVDFSNETPVNPNRTTRTSFLKDLEVQNELGIDLDKSFSSNQEWVKSYVDSLSNDDYNLWDNRRQEWYSLDARKALMDNKDLLNPEKSGGLKYKINTPKMENWVYQYIQNLNEGYEQMHPRYDTAEDWLYNASWWLEEKIGKENMMNRWIDKQDPYSKMWPKTAEQAINNYETFANVVQIPKVLAQIVLNTSAKAVNIFDNINNIKTATLAEWANLINKIRGKEPAFNLNYGEERSNPIGSYIQTVADGLGIWFTVAYPVATYFFSLLGSQNEKINELENLVFSEKPGQAADWLLKQQEAQDLIEIAWLNAKDEESLRQWIADGIVLTIWAITHLWGKKLSGSEIVQLHKEALSRANKFSKEYAKQQMRPNYEMKEAAWSLPEWTEVLNEKWKPIARSTAQWWEFTRWWAIDTWITGAKSYAKMFKEYMSNFYRNYKRWLAPRNPNAPVWELPIVNVKGTTEVKDIPEEKIEETKTPTEEIKVTKTKPVKPVENGNRSILKYIKSISNKITGKKWWMDQALFDKFSTSKDLQNEYVNTIDPYLRSNWSSKPENVIKESLSSFVESIKDQLLVRKLNNQKFRKWQKQYKIETPESEKIKRKEEDKKINDLVKIMSKEIDNPEIFLNYLLKLPQEKIQTLTELIPDYSKNLWLIQDTLALTKAITSSDLLWRFLKFKSTWWTRNKNYIRKYLYKKLNEAYKKAGVKQNMYEIEKMLNQMSEEQLVELEKSMENWKDLPGFIKQDFFDQISWNLEKEVWKGASEASKTDILPTWTWPEYGWNKLIQQWYKNPKTNTPFKTQEEIENYILPNWKTVKQLLTDMNYKLEHKYSIRPWLQGAADLVERAIEYYGDIDKLPEFVLQHELGHVFMWALTTAEYLDLVEGFSKATKSLKKYDPSLNISEYKSLAKSELWATEFIPDSIWLFLTYMDINWMWDYLQPYLSPNLGSKVKKILNDVGKDLWDEFSSVEVNWKKFTPSKEVEKLTERWLNDKEFQTRQTNDLDPKYNNGAGYENRLADWKKIDPNIDFYKWDTDIRSDTFGRLKIKLKDGRSLTWEEYRDSLSPEMKEEFYKDREILNPLYELWKNKTTWDKKLSEYRSSNEWLSQYKDIIKNMDPDIIGLKEENGQIYVQYLIESNMERWELPDRPGQIEVKEVPAKDYFTEEEFNKLPKELQEKINGKEIIKYTKNDRSIHPESPTYYRTPDHQQLDSSELRWNGKDIGITEFFKDPNWLYYIKYLKPVNKNKYQKMESKALPEIDELDTILWYEPLWYQKSLLWKEISKKALEEINKQLPDKWKDIANQQLDIVIKDLNQRFDENRLLSSMEEDIIGKERIKNSSLDEIISIIRNDPDTALYQDAVEEWGRELRTKLVSKNIMQQKYEILHELEDISNNHLEDGEEWDLDFLSNVMERPNLEMFIEDFSDFFDENGFLKKWYKRTNSKWTKENPWPIEELIKEVNELKTKEELAEHIKKHFGKEYFKTDDVETILYNSNLKTEKYEEFEKELKNWESKFDRLWEFLYIPKKD